MESRSQDLPTHQWQNRLLIIVSKSENNPLITSQLNELKEHTTALKERRLLTYVVTPDKYMLVNKKQQWVSGSSYDHLNSAKDFETLLIGLDGHIKKRISGIFHVSDLNAIIDSMPMRKAEMTKQ